MGHNHAHHHHHSDPTETMNPERYRATKRVTLVGAATNTFLCLAQLVGGFITHSAGLIADGFHTLSDLLSDFVVLFAAKKAHEEADEEHPYGHGRIETLATSILGALLLAVAVGILVDLAGRLFSTERLLQPTGLAMFFAAFGIVLKELMYRYTISTANKFNSDMLRANAWHHRSDALSSIIVFVGVLVNLTGFKYGDAIAALLVAVLIARIGYGLLYDSAQQLIDSALDETTVEKIQAAIGNVDGVEDVNELRTRKSGNKALADVRIQVSPRISISEGHQISEAVRNEIIKAVPEVNDVVVHTEAEYHHGDVTDLPLRKALLADIEEAAVSVGLSDFTNEHTLHYLNDGVEVELRLDADIGDTRSGKLERLQHKVMRIDGVVSCSYVLCPENG